MKLLIIIYVLRACILFSLLITTECPEDVISVRSSLSVAKTSFPYSRIVSVNYYYYYYLLLFSTNGFIPGGSVCFKHVSLYFYNLVCYKIRISNRILK
jgi:hypothetical protein